MIGRTPSFFVRLFSVALLLLIGFGAGFQVARRSQLVSNPDGRSLLSAIEQSLKGKAPNEDPAVFDKVWDQISTEHVNQPVDQRVLYYGAVDGIVRALNDRYSSFFDPEATKAFKADLGETEFDGIGAELGVRADALVIIAPLPKSPAERAGLQAGDRLLRIDDQDASDLTVDQAVAKIRGQAGTKVMLTLFRDGQSEPVVLSITRENIALKSVVWSTRKTPNGATAAYVEISHFTEETDGLFNQSAQEFLLKQPRGLIIDLRNNPGGFLDAAVAIASHFLEAGSTVVIESRADNSKTTLESRGTPLLKGRKTVILVDGGSASASEILAGALQDYDVATVIGEKTFGKGSVQTYDEFRDGSSLKLTVAKWLTPLGRSIDGEGIVPDLLVDGPRSATDDPVLQKALELIDA